MYIPAPTMASHQLSTNAAQADAASADAIVAMSADDDAASSADAIAATLTAAKTGDLAALAAASDQNLRAVDAYGSNALHWAAGRGHLALVRHLVEDRGMDASIPAHPPRRRDAPTTRGRTALHYAARNGHLDVVESLVERPGVDADARRRHGVELRPQGADDAPQQLLRAVEALDDTAQPSHGMGRELHRVRRADVRAPSSDRAKSRKTRTACRKCEKINEFSRAKPKTRERRYFAQ